MAKKTSVSPSKKRSSNHKTSKDFARSHQKKVSLLTHYTGAKSHYFAGYTPEDKNARPNGPNPEERVYFSKDTTPYPHILERQEILTKITINTALQAVLEECLNEGESFEKIRQRGLFKPVRDQDGRGRPIDWKSFCAAAEIDPAKTLAESVKTVGLRKFSNRLKKKGLICTSADLLDQIQPDDLEPHTPHIVKGALKYSTTGEIKEVVEPEDRIPKHPALSAFYEKLARYNFEQDKYKREQLDYVQAESNYNAAYLQFVRSQSSDEPMEKPVKPKGIKEPKKPVGERPVDPRIELFNNLFGVEETKEGTVVGFITLFETGAKLWETSATNLTEPRQDDPPIGKAVALDASDLRDGNRITVIPRNFRIVDRFVEIMGQRSNTFVQPPKIKPSGHFDQKTYTDIRKLEEGKVSKRTGLVAEIKVEEMHIHQAYRRTHPIYKLLLRMTPYKSPKSKITDEEALSFMREYNAIFEAESRRGSLVEHWGKKPTLLDFNYPCILERCTDLHELHQSIYAEVMRDAPREWQKTYIEAALQLNHDAGSPSLPEDILESINPKLYAEIKKSFIPEKLKGKERRGKS